MGDEEKRQLKECRQHIQARDWEAAERSASAVLQSNAHSYNALVFLGLALLHLGRLDESESVYKRATQVEPHTILAWQVRARWLCA